MLEDIDYEFNGFDTTFSKNLIDFFKWSLTAVFTFSFQSHEILLYNDSVSFPFSWKNRRDDILILVDS